MKPSLYLSSMGIICALGNTHEQILANLITGNRSGMVEDSELVKNKTLIVGKVQTSLPDCLTDDPLENTVNNRLLLAALSSIDGEVSRLVDQYGAERIGVIIGTSTSGTLEAEAAMEHFLENGQFNQHYHFRQQEMGDPSRFLAKYLKLKGPAYTVSTACSSSGKVFASARNLIHSGICDAVIAGGADSLCRLTAHGFSALESVSSSYCQPFSQGRVGINLGEGAALFTVTCEPSDIKLLGVGESSDAWHISAPHPQGRGAEAAMRAALKDASLSPDDIGYINLHGTATPLNDAMESLAVTQVFTHPVACSSTKPLTGHTLGAAGAVEAGLCWLLLSGLNNNRLLPPNVTDNPVDPDLPALNLAVPGSLLPDTSQRIMSNSFAFGGSNVSVIMGR